MTQLQQTFWSQVRTTFLRGIGVLVPLALTYWVLEAILNTVDGILSPLLRQLIGRDIPGLGLISMLIIIFVIGLLARNLVGRLFITWFEDLLRSIPFVRSIYGAIKDLVRAFTLGGKSKTFREVVMIEYPRKGLYCVGFVTNEMAFTGQNRHRIDFVNVYIPNPPNPTSGFLALIPKEQAVHLDLSVEEGLKLVLSGGIVIPEQLTGRPLLHRSRRRTRHATTTD